MNRSKFWALFHEVWGKDSDGELGDDYDKKAWIYVQRKIEQCDKNRITKIIKSATSS